MQDKLKIARKIQIMKTYKLEYDSGIGMFGEKRLSRNIENINPVKSSKEELNREDIFLK